MRFGPKPIDLTTDLNSDERGNAVHQRCYFDMIIGVESSRVA
jgi:hypothetical protein